MLYVSDSISIPDSEFHFTYTRSSGPGGQNVNKVNSKAVLRWNVTTSSALPEGVRRRFLEANARRLTNEGCILIGSQRYRDQGRNIADCLSRLRELIVAVQTPPKIRKPTKPSKGAKQRRLKEKKVTSDRKQSRRRPRSED